MNFVKKLDLFGVEAAQIPCITGSGAPTTATEGAVGCLYMNTASTSKDVYKCTAAAGGVYTWELFETGGSGGGGSGGGGGSEVITFEGYLYIDWDNGGYASCELSCTYEEILAAYMDGKTVRLCCVDDEVGELKYFSLVTYLESNRFQFGRTGKGSEVITIDTGDECWISVSGGESGGGVARFDVEIGWDEENEAYTGTCSLSASYEEIAEAYLNGEGVQLRGYLYAGEEAIYNLVEFFDGGHILFARDTQSGTEFIGVDSDSSCWMSVSSSGGGGSGTGATVEEVIEELENTNLASLSTSKLSFRSDAPANISMTIDEGDGIIVFHDNAYDENVKLRGIADGTEDTDAVTLGQMKEYVAENAGGGTGGGGGSVELDTTLTQAGKAADAKAVGDAIGDIETALDRIIEIQNSLIGGEA